MNLYLKQNTDPGSTLFDIFYPDKTLAYTVTGDIGSLGGKLFLLSAGGREAARISRIGINELCKYSVVIGDRERLRVTQNLSRESCFRLSKTSWRLRGDFITRSFDIVDARHAVLMTHGRCWNACGDCFGVQITRDEDAAACLSVAAIIDSIALSGTGAAVPASN
ncbi:MAG TPA: tubby C 2 [Ruminococcaceae bacterium]|jgi:uncharacterized protein YxjI|nr:tubby C 2 [Oscillospiraceae bacterium]